MQSCFSPPDVSSAADSAEQGGSPTLPGGKEADGGDSLALEDEEEEEVVSTMMSGEEGEARGKDLEKDTGKNQAFCWEPFLSYFSHFNLSEGRPTNR